MLEGDKPTELKKLEIKPGFYPDLSNEDYHRGPGISKSGLDLVNRSPLHYRTNKLHRKPSTPALVIGSALHKLVLEPDDFSNEFVLEPLVNKRTKDGKAELAQFAKDHPGATMLSNQAGSDPFWNPGDWDQIHFMAEAVRADPFASILLDLEAGKAEQSVFWIDHETRKLCKCRPDFLNEAHEVAVDLKSTDDASYSSFGKSCANFRYHVQSAFYSDGLHEVGRAVRSFVFVAVEKAPPYAVACYVLDDESIRVGRAQYRENLRVYSECWKRDLWPAYPGASIFEPGVRPLELPPWGLRGDVS